MRSTALITVVLLFTATAILASDIVLRDTGTGKTYGPFNDINGEKIVINGREYVVEISEKTGAQKKMEAKLKEIIIPKLDFLNAEISDAIQVLQNVKNQSVQAQHINIVCAFGRNIGLPQVTLKLQNMSLYDTLRYIAEVTDLRMRVDDNAVVLTLPPFLSAEEANPTSGGSSKAK